MCVFLICSPGEAGQEEKAPTPTVGEVFERLRASQKFIAKVEEDAEIPEHTADAPHDSDPEIAKSLDELLGKGKEDSSSKDEPKEWWAPFMPIQDRTTLTKALAGHETLESAKGDLWRLCFYLRCGPGGCDAAILGNCMKMRKCVMDEPQKWQNALLHKIALMDAADREPQRRTSRFASWMAVAEQMRKDICPTLPPVLEINMGDTVAAKIGSEWKPCLILSIYRNHKGSPGGGLLAAREIPRGSLSAARVVCSLTKEHVCFLEKIDANKCK